MPQVWMAMQVDKVEELELPWLEPETGLHEWRVV